VVADGGATGYDDRTGRVRWSAIGSPTQASVWSAAGLVLVTGAFADGPSAVVTAIGVGTGQVAWRFDAPVNLAAIRVDWGLGPLGLIGSGPAGVLIGERVPARVYLLNPATDEPRWERRAGCNAAACSDASYSVADLPGAGRASRGRPPLDAQMAKAVLTCRVGA
jgi:outer membrane protein assembly factor BamB